MGAITPVTILINLFLIKRLYIDKKTIAQDNIDEPGDEKEGEPSFQRRRFEALADEKHHDYTLTPELADYIYKYMAKYVLEKDLKDGIMVENPIPPNINKAKKWMTFPMN